MNFIFKYTENYTNSKFIGIKESLDVAVFLKHTKQQHNCGVNSSLWFLKYFNYIVKQMLWFTDNWKIVEL